jgi:DNA-binding transcriptional LysR family regulator
MRRLRFRLPPPNGLVAFEAAGRLCSFTLAAAELNVTQAAVGRQIRALEARLGVLLFERGHRTLRLTRQGQQFHAVISGSLEWIASAADELRASGDDRQLTIGTTHAFSTFWLLPRLARLRQNLPNLNLHIISADNVDVIAEGIDFAILFGDGKWPGVTASYFLSEEIFPVCSPAYLAARSPLRSVADLLGETLLHPNDGHPGWIGWAEWLAANGADPGNLGPGIHFNNYANAIQSALDGHV